MQFTDFKLNKTKTYRYSKLIGSPYEARLVYLGNYRGLGAYEVHVTDSVSNEVLTDIIFGLRNAQAEAHKALVTKINQTRTVQ
jgi:hypothetical protein